MNFQFQNARNQQQYQGAPANGQQNLQQLDENGGQQSSFHLQQQHTQLLQQLQLQMLQQAQHQQVNQSVEQQAHPEAMARSNQEAQDQLAQLTATSQLQQLQRLQQFGQSARGGDQVDENAQSLLQQAVDQVANLADGGFDLKMVQNLNEEQQMSPKNQQDGLKGRRQDQQRSTEPQIVEASSTAALTEVEGLPAISAEDEAIIQNNPKIAFICQFLGIFRNVMKIQVSKNFITEEILEMQENANLSNSENIYQQTQAKLATIQKMDKLITPFDLEHSILRPQLDPLVGDIVTRLLQKNKWKLKEADTAKNRGDGDDERQTVQSQSYEQWNEALAKKFAVMYKKYLKFRMSFMKNEHEEEVTAVLERKPQDDEKEQDDEHQEPGDKGELANDKEEKHKEDERDAEANVEEGKELSKDQEKEELDPKEGQIQEQTEAQDPKKQDEAKKESVNEAKYRGDYPVSHSLTKHLLQSRDSYIFSKFEHEQSATWKTDQLQLVKLFEMELDCQDPFYIAGQEELLMQKKENEKAKQKENIYLNYVHTEAIEDIDGQYHLAGQGANESKNDIQIKYKQFHELALKTRIDILFYLCQTRLDQESPEFLQEITNIQTNHKLKQQEAIQREKEKEREVKEREKQKNKQAQKVAKQKAKGQEGKDSHKIVIEPEEASGKESEQEMSKENDQDALEDPYALLGFRPLACLQSDLTLGDQAVKRGQYFHIPAFQEAKIVRQDPSEQSKVPEQAFGAYETVCSSYQEILAFMKTLKAVVDQQNPENEVPQNEDIKECQKMHDYLEANQLTIRQHDEATARNQLARNRKLQSVCRIKAAHGRTMRRQTQRESMIQNTNAQVSKVDPEDEAGGENAMALEDYAEKKRLDREARLERRKQIKDGTVIDRGYEEGMHDERGDQIVVQNTQSGRQYKRPKYLQDYDQSIKKGKSADDDEGGDDYKESDSEAEEEDDEDSEEEEYFNGRYRKIKWSKNKRGGARANDRGPNLGRRGAGYSKNQASAFEGPSKRQKISGNKGFQYQATGGQLTDLFSSNSQFLNYQSKFQQKQEDDDQTIELQGNLLLIYKRNSENKQMIDNLNIVLKGQWKIKGKRQEPQDFIYKKSWTQQTSDGQAQTNEALLKELFYDQDITVMIDSTLGLEQKNVIDLSDQHLMLTKLFQSQGQYEGFFNYNKQQVSESFTLLFKKRSKVELHEIGQGGKNSRISILGYGENTAMGPFMLDGHCEVVKVTDLVEKEGLKVDQQENKEPMFMKLKIAKFIIFKKYQNISLRELVEHKREFSQSKKQQQVSKDANQLDLSSLEKLIQGGGSGQLNQNQILLQQLQQASNNLGASPDPQNQLNQTLQDQLLQNGSQLLGDLLQQQQQQQLPSAPTQAQTDLSYALSQLQQAQTAQGLGGGSFEQAQNAESGMQLLQGGNNQQKGADNPFVQPQQVTDNQPINLSGDMSQQDQAALIEQLVHQQVQEHLKQQMLQNGQGLSPNEVVNIDPQLIQAIAQQVQRQMQIETPQPAQPQQNNSKQWLEQQLHQQQLGQQMSNQAGQPQAADVASQNFGQLQNPLAFDNAHQVSAGQQPITQNLNQLLGAGANQQMNQHQQLHILQDQQQFGQPQGQGSRSRIQIGEQDISSLNQQEQEELLRQLQEQMRGVSGQLGGAGHTNGNGWTGQ